jgi:integrase/recombinase XerD
MFLSDAIEGYLLHRSTQLSPETINTDRIKLHQFLDWRGDVEVNEITSDDVRDHLAHHKDRGLSPFTVTRHHASLSAFYTWLTDPEIDLADHNPTDHVPPPKLPKRKPKALTRDEIEALLGAADQMTLKRRTRSLVLFMLDTGARASEVCGVTMDDMSFDTGTVLVTGKGSKQRYVYLGRRALSATWLYVKDERPEPAQVNRDMLFLSMQGYPLDHYSPRHAIVRLARKAGVDATPHAFRHTAAINHLRNGMDLVSLQHLLGHADITTTRGYLSALADEDVEQAAQRTSPSDNWRL